MTAQQTRNSTSDRLHFEIKSFSSAGWGPDYTQLCRGWWGGRVVIGAPGTVWPTGTFRGCRWTRGMKGGACGGTGGGKRRVVALFASRDQYSYKRRLVFAVRADERRGFKEYLSCLCLSFQSLTLHGFNLTSPANKSCDCGNKNRLPFFQSFGREILSK